MNDDIARRLQTTTESINIGRASVADSGAEINMLRRQLAAARVVIAGLDLRAVAHGKELEALAAKAADVVGERAANAVLTTEIDRLRLSLTWIATVNAMDYEYQAKARTALGEA